MKTRIQFELQAIETLEGKKLAMQLDCRRHVEQTEKKKLFGSEKRRALPQGIRLKRGKKERV